MVQRFPAVDHLPEVPRGSDVMAKYTTEQIRLAADMARELSNSIPLEHHGRHISVWVIATLLSQEEKRRRTDFIRAIRMMPEDLGGYDA